MKCDLVNGNVDTCHVPVLGVLDLCEGSGGGDKIEVARDRLLSICKTRRIRDMGDDGQGSVASAECVLTYRHVP